MHVISNRVTRFVTREAQGLLMLFPHSVVDLESST